MKRWQGLLMIVCSFIVCLFLIYLGLFFSSFFGLESKDTFISIYSAFVGSFFAFIGVIITLRVESSFRNKDTIESNKPELFFPTKYDISAADCAHFRLYNKRDYDIPNQCVYIKNSSKAAFKLGDLNIGGIKYRLSSPRYIEKGMLICLSFFYEGSFNCAELEIKDLNQTNYLCKIVYKEKRIDIIRKNIK